MHISQLYTYPIKSIRGCTYSSVTVTPSGFAHDRCFMLIRASDSENMHVSNFPELCLFTTELSPIEKPEKVVVRYTKDHVFNDQENKILPQALEITLQPDFQVLEQVELIMHSSGTVAYDMGKKFNDWFSQRLGYGVRLLYVGDGRRKVLGNVTPNVAPMKPAVSAASSSGWLTTMTTNVIGSVASYIIPNTEYKGVDKGITFADCAPFLVVNSKSWENVSRRCEDEGVDISKFRPNIVVEGADEEFEEDFWAELSVGGDVEKAKILLTANCWRCTSLNVDYSTGKYGTGPSGNVLKKMQKDRRVDKGARYYPVFGRYGFLAQRSGVQFTPETQFRVGDVVEVSKRNEERTTFQWPNLSIDS